MPNRITQIQPLIMSFWLFYSTSSSLHEHLYFTAPLCTFNSSPYHHFFPIPCSLMLVVSAVCLFSNNDLGLFCSHHFCQQRPVSQQSSPNFCNCSCLCSQSSVHFFFKTSTVPIHLALEKNYHAHVLILNSLCSSQPLPMRFCPKLIVYFQILFESHPWRDHLHSYCCFLY